MGCGCVNSTTDNPSRVSKVDDFNITANDLVVKKLGKINNDYEIIRPSIGKGNVYCSIHLQVVLEKFTKLYIKFPKLSEQLKLLEPHN